MRYNGDHPPHLRVLPFLFDWSWSDHQRKGEEKRLHRLSKKIAKTRQKILGLKPQDPGVTGVQEGENEKKVVRRVYRGPVQAISSARAKVTQPRLLCQLEASVRRLSGLFDYVCMDVS